jgi:hypothetical protein
MPDVLLPHVEKFIGLFSFVCHMKHEFSDTHPADDKERQISRRLLSEIDPHFRQGHSNRRILSSQQAGNAAARTPQMT